MSIEQISKAEQLTLTEYHAHPALKKELQKYNLLTPDQLVIFRNYDQNGTFTHIHKFSSKQTPQGITITYLDNESFQNQGLPLSEHEDWVMETTLLYRPELGFTVEEVSPAIRDFLDITRENRIGDLQESRDILLNDQRQTFSTLAYEVQALLEEGQTSTKILDYIETEIKKTEKGEFNDEELIIHRTWEELKRSAEIAKTKRAEVITGDKKSVARKLYTWQKDLRTA